MYGTRRYGEGIYGDFELEVGVIEYGDRFHLVKRLPQNHQGKNVDGLLGIVDDELNIMNFFAEKIGDQAHVDSSDIGLGDWELMLGIAHNPMAGNEERREIIKAKLRGYGTVTKEMLRNAAEAFSGGEVEIIEFPAEFRFVVKFVGVRGVPRNMQSFIDMLEDIKPAHLAYDFSYTFTVWDFVTGTWDSFKGYTWSELRTYEE